MNEEHAPSTEIMQFIISNIANSIGILYTVSNSDAEYGLPSSTGSGAIWIE
jgi:hypothetical protein